MDHEGFFRRWGDYAVIAKFYESGADFTVEDLYQAIKERLAAESSDPTSSAREDER